MWSGNLPSLTASLMKLISVNLYFNMCNFDWNSELFKGTWFVNWFVNDLFIWLSDETNMTQTSIPPVVAEETEILERIIEPSRKSVGLITLSRGWLISWFYYGMKSWLLKKKICLFFTIKWISSMLHWLQWNDRERKSTLHAHILLIYARCGRVRDVYLGKATNLDNGLQIVDWRNAPRSKLFYLYLKGMNTKRSLATNYVKAR